MDTRAGFAIEKRGEESSRDEVGGLDREKWCRWRGGCALHVSNWGKNGLEAGGRESTGGGVRRLPQCRWMQTQTTERPWENVMGGEDAKYLLAGKQRC